MQSDPSTRIVAEGYVQRAKNEVVFNAQEMRTYSFLAFRAEDWLPGQYRVETLKPKTKAVTS